MSESYDIKGRVKEVREAQTFGTFTKRELWLDTDLDTKYPQMISVEFTQDKVTLIDALSVGDDVTVTVNVRGRYHEGTDKVYNTIQAWKVSVDSKAEAPPASAPPANDPFDGDDSDSIPF